MKYMKKHKFPPPLLEENDKKPTYTISLRCCRCLLTLRASIPKGYDYRKYTCPKCNIVGTLVQHFVIAKL